MVARHILASGLATCLTVGIAYAEAPTQAVSALCKDDTIWHGTQRGGACSHHGGVKAFESRVPLPQVWVNTQSKVYHCPGDANYGKTKAGAYMTEAAAKAAGDRPSTGKVCF